MLKNSVHKLWIELVQLGFICVEKVYKRVFVHNINDTKLSSTHFVLTVYTALVNNFFNIITDKKNRLYTSSTQPIKTIYLNKKEYILV